MRTFSVVHPLTGETIGYADTANKAHAVAQGRLSDPQWIEGCVMAYDGHLRWEPVVSGQWYEKHSTFLVKAGK